MFRSHGVTLKNIQHIFMNHRYALSVCVGSVPSGGRSLGQSNCRLLNFLMECENQRRRVTGSRSARSSPAAQGENAPQTRHCAGQDLLRGQDTGNELLLKRSC